MSTTFGGFRGGATGATGNAGYRDPAQLVPVQININYDTEVGIWLLLWMKYLFYDVWW